jgi:hypothetical protein
VLVGGAVTGLVDAAVDGAAHVLDERAEDPLVRLGHREGRIDHHPRRVSFHHQPPLGRGPAAAARAARRSVVSLIP